MSHPGSGWSAQAPPPPPPPRPRPPVCSRPGLPLQTGVLWTDPHGIMKGSGVFINGTLQSFALCVSEEEAKNTTINGMVSCLPA